GSGGIWHWRPRRHGDDHARIHLASKFLFQRYSLAAREFHYRRLAANVAVMVRHMLGPPRRDQSRQRLPCNLREREINDVRIAKQIVEKGLNGRERVGPAQLK